MAPYVVAVVVPAAPVSTRAASTSSLAGGAATSNVTLAAGPAPTAFTARTVTVWVPAENGPARFTAT